jgi:hypothetical protein
VGVEGVVEEDGGGKMVGMNVYNVYNIYFCVL